MVPLEEIRLLKERMRKELYSAHDFHWHSKTALEMIRKTIKKGHAVKIKNAETGTEIADEELFTRVGDYIRVQLPEATFQQFISIFEAFFADFLRLWLSAYPGSLGGKQVKFETIMEASDKDAIIQAVVNKELNEVTYDPPMGWFDYLDKIAKLSVPTLAERERFAEAKASRDVIVHNGGVANMMYETKAGNQCVSKVENALKSPAIIIRRRGS